VKLKEIEIMKKVQGFSEDGDVNIPSDVWWEILEQCEG